jgi:hypothetical protein
MAGIGWRWLRPAWLFNRRVGLGLLWALLVAGIAVAINVIGIGVVGSVAGWERWLSAHSLHFLVGRLLLYAATAVGWRWMRARLHEREPEPEAGQRLRRAEVAAVVAVVLLEASQLLRAN